MCNFKKLSFLICCLLFLFSCATKKSFIISKITELEFNYRINNLNPGDTLYLKKGIYPFDLFAKIPSGKNWAYPVVIMAYPGHEVIIKPSSGGRVLHFGLYKNQYPVHHIEVKGLILDAANVTSDVIKITDGAHHIRIINCELKNSKNQGVLIAHPNSTDNEFIGCKIHDNGITDFEHGIYITSDRNKIVTCEIYNNAGAGINIFNQIGTTNYNQVIGCHIHHNARAGKRGVGIGMHCGEGHIARGNTIHDNDIGIHSDYGAKNCIIENNIFYDNAGYDLILGNQSSNCQATDNVMLKKLDIPEVQIGKEAITARVLNNKVEKSREALIEIIKQREQ